MIETIITAGSSGFIGISCLLLVLRTRIKKMETEITFIQTHTRYDETCNKITNGILKQLENIEILNKETRDDIKKILKIL